MTPMKCRCGCGQDLPSPSRATLFKIKRGDDAGYINGHHERRERNIRWAGGRIVLHGYVFLLRPDHPNARKNGYIAEHRLVMSDHLGRTLAAGELVHHINGNKIDNRIENLSLMTRPAHASLHSKGASNGNWKGGLVPKKCLTCGKEFVKAAPNHARARYCSRACSRFSDRIPRGQSHWASVLTEEKVRLIRRLVGEGRTHQSVADQLGIRREMVSGIVQRKRWAHVV